MKIHLFNAQSELPISSPYWTRLCKEVAAFEKEVFEEFSLHFVDLKEISRLHALYFEDPTPTDCISFPCDEPATPYRVLGDVFVCPAVAIDYAALCRKNPLKETALYVVHGLLHLFGYDDIKANERQSMRAAERRHLAHLAKQGFF